MSNLSAYSRVLRVGLVKPFLLLLALSVAYGSADTQLSYAQVQDLPTTTRAGKRDHATLARAKFLIEDQQPDAAIHLLNDFIASSGDQRYLDQAYLLLAAALMRTGANEEAVIYLEQLLSEFPESHLAYRARLMLASAYAELGDVDAALPLLAEVRSLAPDTQTRREALGLTADVLARKGDYLRAIQASLEEMQLTPEEQRAVPRERIRDLVTHKLDRRSLVRVRRTYPGTFPSDLATIRLIEIHLARNEQFQAEKYLRAFLRQFPSHEHAAAAQELLVSFATALKESEYVIAALLPLSGKAGPFGTESLRGIQIALEKGRELPDQPTIGLAVKDTEADKVFLRSDLYELIDRYRPLAVIGPLRSREVQKVAELAERTETPFLTPGASLPNVRRLGNYVFSTAMTYPLQAREIANHAMTHLALYRFCILYPETTYGRELARWFSQEVVTRGGEVVAVEAYPEHEKDFSRQIKRLKKADLLRDGSLSKSRTKSGEQRIIYSPGFDALFIPGTAMDVSLIVPQLLFFDIQVPLLGTNGWNSPDLLLWADPSLEGSVFVDALYLDSSDPNVQDFVARYRRHYQGNPSIFAAQAYDAAWMVLEAIRQGATTSREVQQHLLRARDLPALGGRTAFNAQGILSRHLFVLQVKEGRIVQAEGLNGGAPTDTTVIPLSEPLQLEN